MNRCCGRMAMRLEKSSHGFKLNGKRQLEDGTPEFLVMLERSTAGDFEKVRILYEIRSK